MDGFTFHNIGLIGMVVGGLLLGKLYLDRVLPKRAPSRSNLRKELQTLVGLAVLVASFGLAALFDPDWIGLVIWGPIALWLIDRIWPDLRETGPEGRRQKSEVPREAIWGLASAVGIIGVFTLAVWLI